MIYQSLTRAEYDALPGINFSALKQGHNRTSAHIDAARTCPRKTTQALKFGIAFHQRCLEPELFKAWTVIDGKTTTKPDCLTIDDVRKIGGMHEAFARLGIAPSLVEAAMTWDVEGMPCKARIDCMQGNDLIDLKSTTDASPHSFKREAYGYLYHAQLAWYCHGLLANDIHVDRVRLIAVEKEEPFSVGDYIMDDRWLAMGDTIIDELLTTWKAGANGYGQQVLDVPEWADSSPLELTIGDETVGV